MSETKNLKEANEAIALLEEEKKALEAEKKALEKTLAAANKKADLSASLQAENNNQAQEIAGLRNDLKAASSEKSRLEEVLQENSKTISNLGMDLKEMKALNLEIRKAQTVAGKPSFEHEGKTYEIDGKSFTYKSKELTPADILEDIHLQAELIELGAGFIHEITDEG